MFAIALRATDLSAADDAVDLANESAMVTEEVVVGGPDAFMTVRHVRIEGSNAAIGGSLAELARRNHGVSFSTSGTPLRNRVLKSYVKDVAPVLWERMRGAAAAFDLDANDDAYSFYALPFNLGRPGCSIVYFPPSTTETGTGVLSRNYDFTTGTIMGRIPAGGEIACTADPYIIELYPDNGYASIYVSSYDLLGGTLDGINEMGLTVALAANDEAARTRPMPGGERVGLTEIKLPRVLLDQCATAEEARELLLRLKHHYTFVPCHYLIADRHGDSFVFEYAHETDQAFVLDGDGAPLCLTNHPLAWETESMPNADSRARYERMTTAIAGMDSARATPAFMKSLSESVRPRGATPQGSEWAPGRTLWHVLYYPEDAALDIDFYLGESVDPTDPARVRTRRSGYRRFQLDRTRTETAARSG